MSEVYGDEWDLSATVEETPDGSHLVILIRHDLPDQSVTLAEVELPVEFATRLADSINELADC